VRVPPTHARAASMAAPAAGLDRRTSLSPSHDDSESGSCASEVDVRGPSLPGDANTVTGAEE
jgi:hypothetical protein